MPTSVSKTCLVRFDNNKYSVTASAVGRPVEIRVVGAAQYDDLFEFAAPDEPGPGPDELVDPAGHLRGDSERWLADPAHLASWARAALTAAQLQHAAAESTASRLVATIHSESAAAVLCLELARDGLPIDRVRAEELLRVAVGPRASGDAQERQSRRTRDDAVLRHVPGRESTDLRNPAQVRELLAAVP